MGCRVFARPGWKGGWGSEFENWGSRNWPEGWKRVQREGGKGDRVNPIPRRGLTLRPRVDGLVTISDQLVTT